MIDELKRNIDSEIEILREIAGYNRRIDIAKPVERKLLMETVDALLKSMKIINDATPELLSSIAVTQRLPSKSEKTNLEKISVKRLKSEIVVALKKVDRERFFKESSISENLIKKIKRGEKNKQIFVEQEFKASRGYVKVSNQFFLDWAIKLINKGYFKQLSIEIKRANLEILFESYIAMIFFTTLISIFVGVFIMMIFLFFKFDSTSPIFLSAYGGDYLLRLVKLIWIPLIVPILTFFALYFYPSSEKKSIARRVDQELPFAVIHMSAISGSGIEPTEIFKIIALNKEYPYLRKEIRKVLNQINLYGYDLVTAVNNAAKSTPSPKLAELFAGLSTSINSGGNLKEFFEKRAETLLLDYRLEREKYTKVAETFMDIYISVVIAAPMILMLLLIMMYVAQLSISFTPAQITFSIILVVALINLLFILFIRSKQPAY